MYLHLNSHALASYLRIPLDSLIEFICLSHEFALQVFNFSSQQTFSERHEV